MPLFEYTCSTCEHQFETLVRGSETPECPECQSTDLQRRLSVFAAHSQAGGSGDSLPAGACGMCGDPRGPGACSMN